jgi:hypothetical protein
LFVAQCAERFARGHALFLVGITEPLNKRRDIVGPKRGSCQQTEGKGDVPQFVVLSEAKNLTSGSETTPTTT